jgi:hypothetical protein
MHIQTLNQKIHRQQGDLINILLFFQNRASRLIKLLCWIFFIVLAVVKIIRLSDGGTYSVIKCQMWKLSYSVGPVRQS